MPRRAWLVIGLLLVSCALTTGHSGTCDCTLPPEASALLETLYPKHRIVEFGDLSEHWRQLFAQDHPAASPGFVCLDFYGSDDSVWGANLLSVDSHHQDGRLVILRSSGDQWEAEELDQFDSSRVPVIWKEFDPDFKYQSADGDQSVRFPNETIVLSAYEAWARVYGVVGDQIVALQVSD